MLRHQVKLNRKLSSAWARLSTIQINEAMHADHPRNIRSMTLCSWQHLGSKSMLQCSQPREPTHPYEEMEMTLIVYEWYRTQWRRLHTTRKCGIWSVCMRSMQTGCKFVSCQWIARIQKVCQGSRTMSLPSHSISIPPAYYQGLYLDDACESLILTCMSAISSAFFYFLPACQFRVVCADPSLPLPCPLSR